jgi:hypothetical protein
MIFLKIVLHVWSRSYIKTPKRWTHIHIYIHTYIHTIVSTKIWNVSGDVKITSCRRPDVAIHCSKYNSIATKPGFRARSCREKVNRKRTRSHQGMPLMIWTREKDFSLWFCVVVWFVFVWRQSFVMLSGASSFFAVLVWLVLHGPRPHHERSTGSHLHSKDKPRRARIVQKWGTRLEVLVLRLSHVQVYRLLVAALPSSSSTIALLQYREGPTPLGGFLLCWDSFFEQQVVRLMPHSFVPPPPARPPGTTLGITQRLRLLAALLVAVGGHKQQRRKPRRRGVGVRLKRRRRLIQPLH